MAITKPMEPFDPKEIDVEENTTEIEVEIVNPDAVSIEQDDGSIVIDFTGDVAESIMGPDHESNLVEFMDDQDIDVLASDLVSDFNSDRESRKDWAKS
jgi:DNA-directed RNA polymerase alpha subunit